MIFILIVFRFSATLCSELRLVAYLLPQPQSVVVKKSEYINNDHIAAAMSPFMLAIEYLTAQHQYLHMQVSIKSSTLMLLVANLADTKRCEKPLTLMLLVANLANTK